MPKRRLSAAQAARVEGRAKVHDQHLAECFEKATDPAEFVRLMSRRTGYSSHAGCSHPATQKARRLCREARSMELMAQFVARDAR